MPAARKCLWPIMNSDFNVWQRHAKIHKRLPGPQCLWVNPPVSSAFGEVSARAGEGAAGGEGEGRTRKLVGLATTAPQRGSSSGPVDLVALVGETCASWSQAMARRAAAAERSGSVCIEQVAFARWQLLANRSRLGYLRDRRRRRSNRRAGLGRLSSRGRDSR